ncbi:hypothetical protein CEUSTIGMA_g4204.t1 [Chlamydomonas eustigma]|uniref:BZIP domain-containing protein n=1 Tax=Chlamydomonas eustigma TaxID=1157962 RepID=A0A250X105_9CHLO|nr:hypothetical protein CEUSTIGMA_g4204.t1 [Chlamydomonas eustigma]|eukprot:GAX76757.1 hypothetical protein CEUSTIGMA_g4204.t1 [Chlamydomonas eustigma]
MASPQDAFPVSDLFSSFSPDFDDLLGSDVNFLSFLEENFVLSESDPCSSPFDCISSPLCESSNGESTPQPAGCDESPLQPGALVELAIVRCSGPPTRKGVARLVTTEVSSQDVKVEDLLKGLHASTRQCSTSSDEDEDSDASNDTDEGAIIQDEDQKKCNKRKAAEVDWRSISDPAERRRQRRLAKNRVTAARSRQRKKVQWAELEGRLTNMDNENKRLRAMLEQLSKENQVLRHQLNQGVAEVDMDASTSETLGRGKSSAEPAVLVFISTLLLLLLALSPGDQALLLGSTVPLVLLLHVLQARGMDCHSSVCDALLEALLKIKLLLTRGCTSLRKSSSLKIEASSTWLRRKRWSTSYSPKLALIKCESVESAYNPFPNLISCILR